MPTQYTVVPGGIYPPIPTFFDDEEQLDLVALQQHIRRLAQSDIAGYVLMGSNGEAVHLTSDERVRLLEMAREVIGSTGRDFPIVAGCGAQSTSMTVAYCEQAARSGADFALILPPSYYRGRMNSQALLAHYQLVADASPLPVLIYNMPASAAGIDLSADFICELAQHPNIIGVKDSSGSVSKLAQVVARVEPTFRVFAGSADVLLPALVSGAVGAVSALANIFPQAVCRLQELFQQEKLEEARILQGRLIPVNAAVTTIYGVTGLKAALEHLYGYGGYPRLPLQALTSEEQTALIKIISTLPREDEAESRL
jgi:4-hydroxy-2-oxoglutarate aldolase